MKGVSALKYKQDVTKVVFLVKMVANLPGVSSLLETTLLRYITLTGNFQPV